NILIAPFHVIFRPIQQHPPTILLLDPSHKLRPKRGALVLNLSYIHQPYHFLNVLRVDDSELFLKSPSLYSTLVAVCVVHLLLNDVESSAPPLVLTHMHRQTLATLPQSVLEFDFEHRQSTVVTVSSTPANAPNDTFVLVGSFQKFWLMERKNSLQPLPI